MDHDLTTGRTDGERTRKTIDHVEIEEGPLRQLAYIPVQTLEQTLALHGLYRNIEPVQRNRQTCPVRLHEGLFSCPAPVEARQLLPARQSCKGRTFGCREEAAGNILLEWPDLFDVDADSSMRRDGEHRLAGAVAQIEVKPAPIGEIKFRLAPIVVAEANSPGINPEIGRKDQAKAGASDDVMLTVAVFEEALGSTAFVLAEQATRMRGVRKGLVQGPVPDIDRNGIC